MPCTKSLVRIREDTVTSDKSKWLFWVVFFFSFFWFLEGDKKICAITSARGHMCRKELVSPQNWSPHFKSLDSKGHSACRQSELNRKQSSRIIYLTIPALCARMTGVFL